MVPVIEHKSGGIYRIYLAGINKALKIKQMIKLQVF